MSETDRNARVEAEVQQRLATERQAAELAQRQADLDAREQALAGKEASAEEETTAAATPRATARPLAAADTRSRVTSTDTSAPRGYDTFYRKLEPHGAWRETADYGYVYQPRKAQQSRDWRPYTDGRWAYTDAGWTWVSDEPFGWATYHYGRWTRLRGVGWVWVPGEEWAPAWVSWRKSDEHVGWAPLPPEARFERGKGIKKWADSYYDIGADEYVFISNEDIGSNEIRRAIVPVEQNVTIVNRTTNVTNITYSNTTVINEGPDYEELRGQSREPLRRLRLERQYEVEENEAPQAVVRGEVIAMMTPLFTSRSAERPRNVGPPIQQVTVERNWATRGDQPEAQRAREKMKAEATPPPDAPSKKYEKPAIAESGSTAPVATPRPSAPPPLPVAATPTPSATATITPRAGGTPAVASRPDPTAPVPPSATPRPSATPSPTAVATATPTPLSTPSPAATSTPRPVMTPRVAPSASPSATAAASATPVPSVEPLQEVPEAAPASRKPMRRPPVEPAVPAATPAVPSATPAALTTPAITAAPVPAVAATPAPGASVDPDASPTAPRRDKKPKRALEPGSGTEVPETPEATPAGANVP